MIPLCSRQYLQVKIVKVQLWSDTATEKKTQEGQSEVGSIILFVLWIHTGEILLLVCIVQHP